MRGVFVLVGLFAAAGCAHRGGSGSAGAASTLNAQQSGPGAALNEAVGFMMKHDCGSAIKTVDRALTGAPHDTAEVTYRATRVPGPSGTLMMLIGSATESIEAGEQAKTATAAVDPAWADLYYAKGWCLVELERVDEAELAFKGALAYIPDDFAAIAELGNIQQTRRDWEGALESFKVAYASAVIFEGSFPDGSAEQKNTRVWGMNAAQWQGRALRGQGFSLVELHRLDEAEAAYKKCLELDPRDAQALRELDFISKARGSR